MTGLHAIAMLGSRATGQLDSGAAVRDIDTGARIAQALGQLGLVMAGLLGGVWLLVWWWKHRGNKGLAKRPQQLLRVVASARLGPRERVHLIEVGDDYVLVGTSPAGLSSLAGGLVDAESLRRRLGTDAVGGSPRDDAPAPHARASASARADFAAMLHRPSAPGSGPGVPEEEFARAPEGRAKQDLVDSSARAQEVKA